MEQRKVELVKKCSKDRVNVETVLIEKFFPEGKANFIVNVNGHQPLSLVKIGKVKGDV